MPTNSRDSRVKTGLSSLSSKEIGLATMYAGVTGDPRVQPAAVADQPEEPHCTGFSCGTMRQCAALCEPMSCGDFVGPQCGYLSMCPIVNRGCPILLKCAPMTCPDASCAPDMLACTLAKPM